MKSEKQHIHTTVSKETYDTMKKLSISYGSLSRVIEEAVDLIKIRDHLLDDIKKRNLDPYKLWHLMRSDFSMVAVGRTTFMSYIDKIPTEPQENNNCVQLIEWFHNTNDISTLTLYEILNAIRSIWIAGNYFWQIQIKAQDKPKDINYGRNFEIAFYHNFNQIKYGKYWSQYFKTVLEKDPINCSCEIQIRNEVFYMKITRNDK
ncbi:hypothetical protein DSAG12_01356 [Promethearchaeum syntrophicum]|uniref:Uncharacterized protein n=1 Tax=Promethearchaeum syntrophicum TaxID=2594042 RepID=A0A5B9D9V9_9ARCH|nr:hypothetical protein [Candidatus Prometheoarchaeum syntrophicum]